jgi:uncharacterized protein YndB with AHSA1/START domain
VKWIVRILGGLVALLVLCVVGLWLAGMRPGHGRVVAEIVIDRPAPQVFRWLADDDRVKKWVGGLTEVRQVSAPAGGGEVGKKFRMVEYYNAQRVEMEMEVTKFEKDRAFDSRFLRRRSEQRVHRDGRLHAFGTERKNAVAF